MKKQKITILYERLSKDDEMQSTSNSILNQQQLLEEYAERNNLKPYIHISDDGYSGTNWNRPGWQELIAKVENDEVSCICIKDNTRLGRDYLRAGLYREMFCEKGVRLIAVNDGFDSERGEDDFTPFREIMAEFYARDTSKKIKSVLAAKGRSGKPTTNTPPYGYVKNPNDKYNWIVDEIAAPVVRRIFQMAMDGMGMFQIARALSDDKVERPSFYQGKAD
ncbi:MAG: recombinase family protein [Oscillospiraceae bacterium]|nr:recombinase family protein [Oscillospiraceae bacterium]